MTLGRLVELWRYPVKSMGGEQIDHTEVTAAGGVVGDRAWAVRDEIKGGIRGAKKLGGLMQFSARYIDPPEVGQSTPAQVTLPDGSTVATDDPEASARITAALDHPVTIWPLRPADDLDHYRRGAPTHDDFDTEIRSTFALEPEDPFPDFSGIPPVVFEFESPPGTYFDAYPIQLLTDASLRRLQSLAPESVIDVRRFRPNLVIATDDEGFPEESWVGSTVGLGGLTLRIRTTTIRCVMTTRGFADLPEDRSIMRTMVRETSQCLGVYADVLEPGPITVGDTLEVLSMG